MSPTTLDYHTPGKQPLPSRCPACGSDRTVKGKLVGDVGFKPLVLRKLFHVTGRLDVDAIACAACGIVSFCVDREKLVGLAGEPEVPAT